MLGNTTARDASGQEEIFFHVGRVRNFSLVREIGDIDQSLEKSQRILFQIREKHSK